MFTSDEIRELGFSKSGLSGYKAADVDEFRRIVADDFEVLENTNAELVEKIKILAAHIEKLQENEESVKTCMINAQIAADKAMKQADMKSKKILADSEEKAEALITEAQNKADILFNETKKKSEEFIATAREKADDIVAEAERHAIILKNETDKKIDVKKKAYERLKNEISSYKSEVESTCLKQLELLKKYSDSEEILDKYTSEDTTNETYAEKFAFNEELPSVEKKEIVDNFSSEIDEIKAEEYENENQGSLFEYQQ